MELCCKCDYISSFCQYLLFFMVLVAKYLKNKFGCNFCNNDKFNGEIPPNWGISRYEIPQLGGSEMGRSVRIVSHDLENDLNKPVIYYRFFIDCKSSLKSGFLDGGCINEYKPLALQSDWAG